MTTSTYDMRDYYKVVKQDEQFCRIGELKCGGMFDPGMDCRVCRIPLTAKMEQMLTNRVEDLS